jgi:hypothetical protein
MRPHAEVQNSDSAVMHASRLHASDRVRRACDRLAMCSAVLHLGSPAPRPIRRWILDFERKGTMLEQR